MSRGPHAGTLWRVNQPGLVAATLNPINKIEDDIRWYLFDNIAFLERESTLLYLGDETLMVSHWELLEPEEYYNSNDYYKKFLAAIFLHNDKKIYVFYDDHYDLWEMNFYLKQIK